jgi:acyl-CoA reductase-like NAD-dependent aldehyde dehydrogenase
MAKEYLMYIDGMWAKSSTLETIEVRNPYNGSLIARVQKGNREDAKTAVDAAFSAKDSWAETLAVERADYLYRLYDLIKANRDEFVDVLVKESGSTFKKASAEVLFTLGMLRSAAEETRRVRGETIPSDQGKFSFTIRQPAGVVAAISPFNFPLLLSMKKVFHALAFGNTVVLKPASATPVNELMVAELIETAGFPAGVFNLVTGPGETVGDELVTNPKVGHITFTGEHRTGRSVAEKAGRNLKKVTLELGSSDPLIILKDADLSYAVDAAVFGAFFHQGEICMSAKRIIVEEPIADKFLERFVERVKKLNVGDPTKPETDIGPIINQAHMMKIHEQVQDALSKGAKLLCGGRYEGQLYWPTVVSGITPEMRMYREEVFGPARSVITVSDENEAVKVANDTIYGLSSGIITGDVNKALLMARRLEFGMVHINDSPVNDEPHVPFGGVKGSGIGREGGMYSAQELTELKWITIQQTKKSFPI